MTSRHETERGEKKEIKASDDEVKAWSAQISGGLGGRYTIVQYCTNPFKIIFKKIS